jgi:hypothetical protein
MKPAEPHEQTTWGIIRYAAGSGMSPQDDAAAFDGWYADRNEAMSIATDWARRYPQWIVALVRSDTVWFGEGDFSAVANQPLTARERQLTGRTGPDNVVDL